MNYNFTDRVRKVLAMAREEALRLGSDYVAPEHMLLGIVREGEGVAAAVLMNVGIEFDRIREAFTSQLPASTAAELPYTSQGKKVLDNSIKAAQELRHYYVGTEHVLLGILSVNAPAAQLLNSLGLTLNRARDEVQKLLSADVTPPASPTPRAAPAPARRSSDTERLLRQLKATYQGPSWHGPTLRELLVDVSPAQAAQRGISGAHSIWEIVLHSAAWKRVVAERLDGSAVSLQGEQDWPPVSDTSEAAWQSALAALDEANEAVIQRVRALVDNDLDRSVPGQNVSIYATVHGVIQHDIYHAGQVALLKKTVRV